MTITEDVKHAQPWRLAYRTGVEHALAARRAQADAARAKYISPEQVRQSATRYRRELADILGWPLNESMPEAAPKAACVEETTYAPGVTMRRVQIEAMPGLPFYGLWFCHDDGAKRPLVISLHGGGGSPEAAADLLGPNNYAHMTAKAVDLGMNVFAPQLLLWREEDEDLPRIRGYGMKNNRHQLEVGLRHVGGGIAALEIWCIMRGLGWLTTLPQVDQRRVGMIGLSYGGFYTQMVAALDTRIKAASTNAFFNDRYTYCGCDYTWRDQALRFRDAEICGLIAPRALCVHVGRQDAVFSVDSALPEIERLKPYYEAQGALDRLKIIVSDVNHTLTQDGQELSFIKHQLEL